MQISFIKMQGAGNDFVVLDARTSSLRLTERQYRFLADRHRGIGCDQLIELWPAIGADAEMRIFNADGSEAQACGNATRCVARLLRCENGKTQLVIRTRARDLSASLGSDDLWTVDMGEPLFGWSEVPLAREADTLHLPLARDGVSDPAALSMGNPHVTFFVNNLQQVDVPLLGAYFEREPIFPQHANIGFAQILAPNRLRLRVWERGAGLTLACGSGACAAVVNALRRHLVDRKVSVEVDGGELEIEWREDGHVLMKGPAEEVFRGKVGLPS